MTYTPEHIASIINGTLLKGSDSPVSQIIFDSRKINKPTTSLFFALKGPRKDGHDFIGELYQKGVRNFVVSKSIHAEEYTGANIITVRDTLNALQTLAAWHRSQFNIPVIGITGSNGKTIVKEWLYQLLQSDYNIVRSPKSYNSQIGVPLSVWQMNEQHTLAIFEAGISRPGEMEKLEKIIRPTIGILTNIGEAHGEGFESKEQKENEKRILFKNAELPEALKIKEVVQEKAGTKIVATQKGNDHNPILIYIPFSDDASVQNAITCWQVMLMLGYDNSVIEERMKNLQPVNMRLELKKGINGCSVINDSYSADLSSLEIALNFLNQQSGGQKKTVILSDFLQSSLSFKDLFGQIINELCKYNVSRLIGIGEHISSWLQASGVKNDIEIETFLSTDDFIRHFRFSTLRDELILVKGARIFAFERIVQLLELKAHETVLEINLSAIVHNLKEYQKLLEPETKIMGMVKAFAYGSGGAEIAGILQYHKVDYLGVAYADEGVELRKAGISLPIMVMNPEESAFDVITEYNLEPELYSFEMLNSFDEYLKKEGVQNYPVHIEIETGMNRLGFAVEEMRRLIDSLKKTTSIKVQSVFSHLAASEDVLQDEFTHQQFNKFKKAADQLKNGLEYQFLCHIANSAGTIRHKYLQLQMVRLGIGLYGVDSSETNLLELQTVATLKSTIAQIKSIRKGESISYNRKTIVSRDSLIATIRIGYADGYPRRLGNGKGQVYVKGKMAPVVGTICMDMFMIDVTEIAGVKEGDEVVIFGKELPVQEVAKWAETIPYEIMTGISQRVKRMYYEE
ncbi:MAG TPA: alanine racemase [Chitinophagaceae bacterium]|nr:alanine racemase [Chitinophagaceae bacterium]